MSNSVLGERDVPPHAPLTRTALAVTVTKRPVEFSLNFEATGSPLRSLIGKHKRINGGFGTLYVAMVARGVERDLSPQMALYRATIANEHGLAMMMVAALLVLVGCRVEFTESDPLSIGYVVRLDQGGYLAFDVSRDHLLR